MNGFDIVMVIAIILFARLGVRLVTGYWLLVTGYWLHKIEKGNKKKMSKKKII
ncbi:MAG: hypothetical protein WA839_01705 [Flavobacteriaceae bacterium]